MPLAKPPGIEADAFKSAKWDELTQGRGFARSDAPQLSMLCEWYKVADAAMEELESFNGQTAYTSESGELRPFPQVATLKSASSEIRALSKQLGLTAGGEVEEDDSESDDTLTIVLGNRAKRRARAAG